MVRNIAIGEGALVFEEKPSQIEIVMRVVNSALLKPLFSDCHAEANAVSVCAATGTRLGRDVTCYVTKAPCTECFKLLAMSMIGRIVCPESYTSIQVERCVKRLNIEWITLRSSREAMKARDEHAAQFEDKQRINALRNIRKARRRRVSEEKRKARENRKRKLEGGIGGGGGGEEENKSKEGKKSQKKKKSELEQSDG